MPTGHGFSHVGVSTHDMDATVHFYEEVLGFPHVVESVTRVTSGGTVREVYFEIGEGQFIVFMEAKDVPGIPADNAAYDGEAIRRFVMATDDGFWEVEFHRQLHAASGSLAIVSGATASYGRSFPFLTIAAHRYQHGRYSGAWRVSRKVRSVPAVVAAFPLVPFALAARTWRRVRSTPVHRSRFLRALPLFLVLAFMWAFGEAVGALSGSPVSRRPSPVPA